MEGVSSGEVRMGGGENMVSGGEGSVDGEEVRWRTLQRVRGGNARRRSKSNISGDQFLSSEQRNGRAKGYNGGREGKLRRLYL